MKKPMSTFIYLVVGLAAFLIVGYFVIIVYINWPDRPIAINISVSQEWNELRLDHPLTFKYRDQSLKLQIKDFSIDRGSSTREIRLPNDTVINPEIEIVADDGNAVKMQHSGFTYKYFDAIDFRPSDPVQTNERYSVIRIRSDVPFYCEGIYWIDYNPK
jgi:hypothetical protein